jgi:hypothetical protein
MQALAERSDDELLHEGGQEDMFCAERVAAAIDDKAASLRQRTTNRFARRVPGEVS